MIAPPPLENEVERLKELKEYSILDTLPEKEYDDITFMASQICGTPISLVSLVDNKRQWFKSNKGLNVQQTKKEHSFCGHAIADPERIFYITDARKDQRFNDNPLVTGYPYIVFYAGVPLVNHKGFALGTLCVIDNQPRELNENQLEALKSLSNIVIKLFETRKELISSRYKNFELKARNKTLNEFVRIAAHDIRAPMNSIISLTELFELTNPKGLDKESRHILSQIRKSAETLNELITGILKLSKDSSALSREREEVMMKTVVQDVIELVDAVRVAKWELEMEDNFVVYLNKVALEQIFINLFSNAIKYNDKKTPRIRIQASQIKDELIICVSDNGPGIPASDREKIFNLFQRLSVKGDEKGTGIGLATVKSLVVGMGGDVSIQEASEGGTEFRIVIKT